MSAARVLHAAAGAPGSEPAWRGTAVRMYLAPGRLYASADDAQVTTILGSCVAVCLWDAHAQVGGVNHFLLPNGAPASPRFGDSAVPMLIERVLALGAHRGRLAAKVFGGACVLDAFRGDAAALGARNVQVAHATLRAAQIPVVGRDVGGDRGRRLMFDVRTGSAWIRAIEVKS